MSFSSLVSAAAALAVVAAAGAAQAQGAAAPIAGAELFSQNCAACHQAQGQGIPGAFPALAGNAFVQGDPKGPAWVVTHGRGGMPNFSEDLSDAQVASILSFVRASFGNKAAPLDAAVVASVRSEAAPPNNQAGLPFH